MRLNYDKMKIYTPDRNEGEGMSCETMDDCSFRPVSGDIDFNANIASVKWFCSKCGKTFTEGYEQHSEHLMDGWRA